MKLSSDKIELKYPLYIGWFVLELSKYHMYDLFYNVFKKHYGDNVSLIYMDTDSFLLEFKNLDVYEEMAKEPLSDYMDTSNFPKKHPLFNEDNKGKLGLLKSETADIPIVEAICLAPKTYSVHLENDSIKNTAKGVNKTEKNKLRHEIYRDVHDGTTVKTQAICSTIRSFHNKLYTLKIKKNALVKIDRKRFWINREKSLAYDHPDAEKTRNIINVEKSKKRKIEQCEEELPLDLTFKRVKNITFS